MVKSKILYIAGYSRSGSTVLDIILGSHKNLFGTGELVYLFDDWLNETRLCTCGKSYKTCDFWKDLALPEGITFAEAISVIRAVESRSAVENLLAGKIPVGITDRYNLIQSTLYGDIISRSGKSIVIDSSKSSRDMAGRFYALQQYTDLDVYVVHLVKNGLSIVKSYVEKGRNWAMEGHAKNDRFLAARSSVGWRLANSLAQRLGDKMPPQKYLPLQYESLVKEPEDFLNKIGSFIGEDFSTVIDTIKQNRPFLAGHNVGGNRLRLEKEIRLLPAASVRKIEIDIISKLTFKVIAGKLNKRLGY